ncbi:unnamed protein product [Cylindrotheca closterium]|uniref:Uncharacterized protein n=1 Tax=Cylindrotheca closterium TaxID=2856 RepID=A0AAD2CCR8_9STRA|nr:unnamed protein product [Cylindrotheca closterium]
MLKLSLLLLACSTPTTIGLTSPTNNNQVRRDFIGLLGGIGSFVLLPDSSSAASASQEQKDKDNIVKGYDRLQYLLDNWEKETTVCRTGQETTFGDRCERTPLKVMDYLGFKDIRDPLYKADLTMMRLKNLVPDDREGDFYEAMEVFNQNAEEASSMAFISSWGEANPGGGKDRVQVFIERSKKNVIASRDSLKTVIDVLKL